MAFAAGPRPETLFQTVEALKGCRLEASQRTGKRMVVAGVDLNMQITELCRERSKSGNLCYTLVR